MPTPQAGSNLNKKKNPNSDKLIMKFLSCAGLFSFTSEVRNKITLYILALGFCLLLPQEQESYNCLVTGSTLSLSHRVALK